MIVVLILISAISLLGIGVCFLSLFEKLFHLRFSETVGIGDFGLAGIAGLAFIGSIANFFVSLSPICVAVFLVVSLLAIILWRKKIQTAIHFGKAPILTFSFIILGALYSAVTVGESSIGYDAGLYHIQAIRWITESPIVLGLANLHDRLGYNSLWHVVLAEMTWSDTNLNGALLGNIALVIFTMLSLFQRMSASWEARLPVTTIFGGLVILLFSFCVLNIAGTFQVGTDLAPASYVLCALLLMVQTIETADNYTSKLEPNLFLLSMFAVVAVTFKISQFPIVVVVLSCFVFLYRKISLALMVSVAIVTIIFFTIWILRGIALSGCVIFPEPWSCLTSLYWVVPASEAANNAAWVKSWARMPGVGPAIVLADWHWLRVWWHRIFDQMPVLLLPATLCVVSIVFIVLRISLGARFTLLIGSMSAEIRRALLGVLAAILFGIVFWFSLAPEPRFGMAFLVAFPALALALTLPEWLAQAGARLRAIMHKRMILLSFFVCMAAVLMSGFAFSIGQPTVNHSWQETWLSIPAPSYRVERTISGHAINVPNVGN